MIRSLALLSAVTLVALAGCSQQTAEEDDVSSSGDSALSGVIDKPAEVPADGAKPKIEQIDLSKIDFDLAQFQSGNMKIDVLDTGFDDHDYMTHARDLKWVESDRRELPAIVDTFAHGADIGGGKCRVKSLSLKKVVVGCKWTW